MNQLSFNSSIICVDDEEGILEAYRKSLQDSDQSYEQVQGMLSRRRQRMGKQASGLRSARQTASYNLFAASSGEEAVEIVRRELSAGRQIAAGFFDMSMPGGIDGSETIKRILQMDNQMLCAVVTAYTDRSPNQLAALFKKQDDWLYFNKPFTIGELQQTAYHLVTAWNQRRQVEALISNMEMMQNGLLYIINSVSDINKVPPLMLEKLLQGVLNHFLGLLDSRDGFVALLPDKMADFQIGTGVFEKYTDFSTSELQPQWSLAQEAITNKMSMVKGNMVAAPLLIAHKVLGVLFVQSDTDITSKSELLDMYAIQAVNMIQQSKLYEELDKSNIELSERNQDLIDLLSRLTKSENLRSQFEKLSYMDSLVGIPNRRYLEARFEEELSRSQRHKFSLACLMIDIDKFKAINDTHGHQAGDYVLKEMGRLFLENKRAYEVIGRFGGEEFVMVLKQVDPGEALMVSERLRGTIENHPFSFEGQRLPITVSIGVTTLIPTAEHTVDSILHEADKAMYLAKESGRNRCVSL